MELGNSRVRLFVQCCLTTHKARAQVQHHWAPLLDGRCACSDWQIFSLCLSASQKMGAACSMPDGIACSMHTSRGCQVL